MTVHERTRRDRRMELHPLRHHQPQAGARRARRRRTDRCITCRAWHIVEPDDAAGAVDARGMRGLTVSRHLLTSTVP